MAKKNIYTTPEMEKEALLKEIEDLKNLKKKLSDELRKKALSSTMNWIAVKKKGISDVQKQILSKQNQYYKLCTPDLFR